VLEQKELFCDLACERRKMLVSWSFEFVFDCLFEVLEDLVCQGNILGLIVEVIDVFRLNRDSFMSTFRSVMSKGNGLWFQYLYCSW